ncbi:hypothetical protein P22_0934 [Propionispora sp. 2/2-37]|uniref:methyl-accepting chemotaxis protein n=1 Tax=Propionispora sp. 2/2-37 TaxID=1677858 RepID=UPI0006BB630F|nr:methyl-accepting chemotaxis protein [Propionispora sp. 2/2-37]CUH94868.1 hypothetical protein P22_0934 [Propionispora sp. 2/2-37]
MNWLNHLKVAQKLLILITLFIFALLSVGGTGYYYLQKTSNAMNAMYAERLLAVEWINDNRAHARAIEADIRALILAKNGKEKFLADLNKRAELFDKNLSQYEKLPLNATEQNKIKELRDQLTKYREARKPVLELALQQKNDEAYMLYEKQAEPLAAAFQKTLIEMGDLEKNAAEQMNIQNKSEFLRAVFLFSGIIVFSVTIGLLLSWTIVKQILKRLHDAVTFLSDIAAGDFSQNVKAENLQDQSEFGTLSQAVDKMNQNIRALIRQISHTSEQLASSSEELNASAEQSAQASNQVAESITEVATGANQQLHSVNSTTGIVNGIANEMQLAAHNAVNVAAAAEKTSQTATDGDHAIHQAIVQMNVIEEKTNATAAVITDLAEKSTEIQQIVETISAISGQTNLLALNAAIEAARAGEAGRGFAVVADEVRKLAEQSAQSAKNIANLIAEVQQKTGSAVTNMQDGIKEVKAGSQAVDRAGASFREILQMIKNISQQVTEISSSIQQISSGSEQMVNAVQEINHAAKNTAEQTQTISAATEEQSASMEEIAASSQHLANMAENLQNVIRQFKI